MQDIDKKFIKKNRLSCLLFVFILPALMSLMQFLTLPINNLILETVSTNDGRYTVGAVICIALVTIALVMVVRYVSDYSKAKFKAMMVEQCKNDLLEHSLKVSPTVIKKLSSGEFLQAFNQINAVAEVPEIWSSLILSGIMIVALFSYTAITIHWKMLLFLIGIIILMPIFQIIMQPLMQKQDRILEQINKGVTIVDESAKGLEVVKSYHMQKHISKLFLDVTANESSLSGEKAKYLSLITLLQKIMQTSILILIPVAASSLIRTGEASKNAVVIATFAFFMIANSVFELIGQMPRLKDVGAARKAINTLWEHEVYPQQSKATVSNTCCLKVQDVSFMYDDEKAVLDNISFELPKAGVVILTGKNGCGKSTLLQVLCGIFEPTSGNISCGAVQLTQKERMDLFSVMLQDSYLFPVSIGDNIEFANAKKETGTLESFLSEFGLEQAFEQFPNGLETMLEEEGRNISGGQRQLITFCRALRKNSPVILLDEPTASADTQTEQIIMTACQKAAQTRCILMITHQETSLQMVTHRISMENGNIKEGNL